MCSLIIAVVLGIFGGRRNGDCCMSACVRVGVLLSHEWQLIAFFNACISTEMLDLGHDTATVKEKEMTFDVFFFFRDRNLEMGAQNMQHNVAEDKFVSLNEAWVTVFAREMDFMQFPP